MQIQRVNGNQQTFKSGLYFSKSINICHKPSEKYLEKASLKVSEYGYKYPENTQLPEEIINRFKENKLIKSLSEKFDTFVFHSTLPENKKCAVGHVAFAKLWWVGGKGEEPRSKFIAGISEKSMQDAIDKMFSKIV